MRLDRALTLSVIRPMRALVVGKATTGIPILMYHSIGRELDADRHPYYRTVTSPSVFARHIEALQASGFEAIALSTARDLLCDEPRPSGSRSGTPKVVITFDDGFRDFLTEAFPVLERAGYTATVFVATGFVGKTFITGAQCLSAGEIRMLSDWGIEFGSHSVTHRRLVELSPQELQDELVSSKSAIEDMTGRRATTFSFPFRFPEENTGFVARLGDTMDSCGYAAGVTTAIGCSSRHDDPRFLPRLPMNDCDDPALLDAKLAGHYDWLRSGQLLRKRTRSLWHRWARA